VSANVCVCVRVCFYCVLCVFNSLLGCSWCEINYIYIYQCQNCWGLPQHYLPDHQINSEKSARVPKNLSMSENNNRLVLRHLFKATWVSKYKIHHRSIGNSMSKFAVWFSFVNRSFTVDICSLVSFVNLLHRYSYEWGNLRCLNMDFSVLHQVLLPIISSACM